MKTILFILQNAYRSEKYQYRNLEEWYCDLKRSHTGRRLFRMIPQNISPKVINASPKIGDDAKSCFPFDIIHVNNMIEKYKPDYICACGEVAQDGCKRYGIEFIPLPHPAWRRLSIQKEYEIKTMIANLV